MKAKNLREKAGWFLGYGLGGLTGAVAFLRNSRMFHPRGIAFEAKVEMLPEIASAFEFANLQGHALVRLSSAWWKNVEWRDVLGIAIRFSQSRPLAIVPHPLDQDLLFATIRYPWTTPFAPFRTHHKNFMKNDYYAVSPFSVGENSPLIKFKLVPVFCERTSDQFSRKEKFFEAVDKGLAQFHLLIQTKANPVWAVIARVTLLQEAHLNQEALRFSPFQNGLNIRPRGFVHYLRIGAYRMSQAARPIK